jgi:hypothetical protein
MAAETPAAALAVETSALSPETGAPAPSPAETPATAPSAEKSAAKTPVETAAASLSPETPPKPGSKPAGFAQRLMASRRSRSIIAVAGGVALGLIVVLVEVLGPRHPARAYPDAAAPSDPAGRLAYYREGAAAGDPNAQLRLAIMYAKGDGVTQDYAVAATWFHAAANQGVGRAQYDMGVIYERGRGVKVDLTEAADWYLKAAQTGYPLAQYNLAVCYTKGQGLRKDLTEAAVWYQRAATQGVVQAMVNLAAMYESGEGVAASPVDAYAWYFAAGRRDSQTAAQHADELLNSLPQLDQIRAKAVASDVAASIHDPDVSGNPEAAAAAGR